MVHLQTMWHEFTAQQGNEPGAQQGEVVVTLMQPVGGVDEVTLPSNDVSIAAEAGNLIGLQLILDDGRRLFVGAANLAGIVDAPLSKEVRDRRRAGQPATGGRRPEQGLDELPQDRPEHEGRGADERRARGGDDGDDGQPDPELEARIPAANRTDEQAERAQKREQGAESEQQARTREDDRRAHEQDRAEGEPGDQGAVRSRPGSRSRAGAQGSEAPDAATDRADAAHDRSDAAQDREAAARDKAASRRSGK
jgi:hypothetical protein